MADVTCALCGRHGMHSLRDRVQARLDLHKSPNAEERQRARRWRSLLLRLGLGVRREYWTVRSFCEIDHALPVCEGGTNLRTNLRLLCVPCHKGETRQLAARRAARRRAP